MEINIRARVKHLVWRHGTRNPERIAKDLGVHVEYKTYSEKTKGYFVKTLKQKFIIVNDTLDEDSKRIVLAHELGHAVLHSSDDIYTIREHTLFPVGPYEVEANKFAAELLIDSRDIDKHMLEELNIEQISRHLGVNEQLVEYKLAKK